MRKYILIGLAVVGVIAAAGFIHASNGRSRSQTEGTSAASSSDDGETCPLRCFMNYCGLCK
jgi:hypothetical protein